MAELPASWGLRTKKNKKGTLDVIGKTDTGQDYRVRITDKPEITERDVAEIAAVDREKTTAKKFVGDLVQRGREKKQAEESAFENELMEAAGPVVRAGLGMEQSFVGGYSGKAAENFDAWIASLGEEN
jgi:hypothetical protein